MSKEAMTLALEALMPYQSTITREYTKVDAAIDALHQAIAEAEPVQVSALEFVEMVMEKEHLIGRPIIWAEWPSKENT